MQSTAPHRSRAPAIHQLVRSSMERSGAHGVARIAGEKALYIRALWLVIWLASCCLFLRYLVGFVDKLRANEVTTNFHADKLPFEYPDLYFCFDNPVSGSRHLHVDRATVARIRQSFNESIWAMARWCDQLDEEICAQLFEGDLAEVQMNSLPYRSLADQLGHIPEQSIFVAEIVQTNGLLYQTLELPVSEFYHPSHLRCFRTHLNDTHRQEMYFAGPGDSLYFLLMMDAPDSRMGQSALPGVQTLSGNLKAAHWALDKYSLSSRIRGSTMRVYVTRPGHYPSEFDDVLLLEAGRAYDVRLDMREQVHREDPTSCVEAHPDVQFVNPYDNSAYTVAYNYAYCFYKAVQDQLRRELNATLAYLPHPWPPSQRSLYNMSSGWGSRVQDVTAYLDVKARMHSDEPHQKCARSNLCNERVYLPIIESVAWPNEEAIDSVIENTKILDEDYFPDAPGLRYLRQLAADRDSGNSSRAQMLEYIRANFLQLQVRAKKPDGDQIIFTPAYNFESFVAEVGGVMGILLGMSLLTVCELLQFLHDLSLLVCAASSQAANDDADANEEKITAGKSAVQEESVRIRAIRRISTMCRV